jgi:hypothetical protein
MVFACELCTQKFNRRDNLVRHVRVSHKCAQVTGCPHVCQICGYGYARLYNLEKHYKLEHPQSQAQSPVVEDEKTPAPASITPPVTSPVTSPDRTDRTDRTYDLDELKQVIATVDQKIDKLVEKLDKSETHTPLQQNLNVMCLCPRADFLGILAQDLGSVGRALEYIANCAMSDVSGDSHLMARLYLKEDQSALHFDPSRKYITYHDGQQVPHVEDLDLFGHTMGNCLQNVYLIGINRLMSDTLDTRRDPNQLLDTYDFLEWNQHLSRLGQKDHQRKILRNLNIPIKHYL